MKLTIDDFIGHSDPGRFLYHYTSPNIALEFILPKMRFRMGRYSGTNDPLESKSAIEAIPAVGRRESELFEIIHAGRKADEEVHRSLRIACFTRDSDSDLRINSMIGRGFNHSRMWSQYAENHRGVCLVFRWEHLAEKIRGLETEHEVFGGEVEYRDIDGESEIAPHVLQGHKIEKHGAHDAAWMHYKQHLRTLLFRKSEDWADEHEYRWVLKSSNCDQSVYFEIDSSLHAVIAGFYFPEVYMPSLIEICNKAGVNVAKMNFCVGRFSVPILIGPNDFPLA